MSATLEEVIGPDVFLDEEVRRQHGNKPGRKIPPNKFYDAVLNYVIDSSAAFCHFNNAYYRVSEETDPVKFARSLDALLKKRGKQNFQIEGLRKIVGPNFETLAKSGGHNAVLESALKTYRLIVLLPVNKICQRPELEIYIEACTEALRDGAGAWESVEQRSKRGVNLINTIVQGGISLAAGITGAYVSGGILSHLAEAPSSSVQYAVMGAGFIAGAAVSMRYFNRKIDSNYSEAVKTELHRQMDDKKKDYVRELLCLNIRGDL